MASGSQPARRLKSPGSAAASKGFSPSNSASGMSERAHGVYTQPCSRMTCVALSGQNPWLMVEVVNRSSRGSTRRSCPTRGLRGLRCRRCCDLRRCCATLPHARGGAAFRRHFPGGPATRSAPRSTPRSIRLKSICAEVGTYSCVGCSRRGAVHLLVAKNHRQPP